MGYNLTIDQGNTAAKVALWHTDRPGLCLWRLTYRPLTAADIYSICSRHQVTAAIIASVAPIDNAVLQALEAHGTSITVLGADTPGPLTIQYDTPRTLGADRIAAAAGAVTLANDPTRHILVADVGTAITYDHVAPGAVFAGGNIAPGIYMRLKALNSFTARLPLIEPYSHVQPWGTDTASALVSGAVSGVLAELSHYRSLLPEGSLTVITGGAAHLVADNIPFPHLLEENLVDLGLDSILRYMQQQPAPQPQTQH